MIYREDFLKLFHIAPDMPYGLYASTRSIFYPIELETLTDEMYRIDDPELRNYLCDIAEIQWLRDIHLVLPFSTTRCHIFPNSKENMKQVVIGPSLLTCVVCSVTNNGTNTIWKNDRIFSTYDECMKYCWNKNDNYGFSEIQAYVQHTRSAASRLLLFFQNLPGMNVMYQCT